MQPLIAIVGPTAIGKTALAVRLAGAFHGEIVGADSRQVYRYMDVGTGKPSAAEQAMVPHHLINVVDPDEEFNLAHFLARAQEAIAAIHDRGRTPFLVGGAGQYVWALLRGFRPPQVPPNSALRNELTALAEKEGGVEQLRQRLATLDAVSAGRIDSRNVRRVIRAIEVTEASGIPFSEARRAQPPAYRTLVLGLTASREEVYRRIDARAQSMVAAGWLEEVRGLLRRGYGPHLPALSSLGYGPIVRRLAAELTLEEAVSLIQRDTRRFARRQGAWFRAGDPTIAWLDVTTPGYEAEAEARVRTFQGPTRE